MPQRLQLKLGRSYNVFLTGVTGFFGRYLLYLLCEADWIEDVYVLIRDKRGVTAEERLKDVLNDPLLKAAEEAGTSFANVKVMSGDLLQPKLGLSMEDQKLLSERVSLVIQNAAALSFAAHLQDGISSNTTPAWELYQMCCNDFELRPAYILISTIATNSHMSEIPESVSDFSVPASAAYNYISSLPRSRCAEQTEWLKEGRLDGYAFSKGLLEGMISEDMADARGTVPVYFVRPGGIISAIGGPLPGWMHSTCFYGVLGYYIYEQKIPFFLADSNNDINMAPVDYVANLTMACCAEALEKRNQRNFSLQVVNGSKCCIEGVTFNRLVEGAVKHYESLKEIAIKFYPDFTPRKHPPKNPWYLKSKFLLDSLFAILVWIPLFFFKIWEFGESYRYKKVRKLANFVYKYVVVLGPYLLRPIKIRHGYLSSLHEKYGEVYPCDASHIKREDFIHCFLIGLAKYIVPSEALRQQKIVARMNSKEGGNSANKKKA